MSNRTRFLLSTLSLAALATLAACGERTDGQTVGQKVDKAVAKGSEVAREAGQGAREVGRDAKQASERAGTAVMGAAGETKNAAADATSKAGAKVDDAAITSRVNAGLLADKDLSATKIDVDTREGVVTLSGTAPSATAKARAGEIVRNVRDVKSVNNQLTVTAG